MKAALKKGRFFYFILSFFEFLDYLFMYNGKKMYIRSMKAIRVTVEEFEVDKNGKYIRTGQIIQNEKRMISEDSEYEDYIKAFMLDEVKREILKK